MYSECKFSVIYFAEWDREKEAILGDGNEFIDALDKDEDAFDDTFRV